MLWSRTSSIRRPAIASRHCDVTARFFSCYSATAIYMPTRQLPKRSISHNTTWPVTSEKSVLQKLKKVNRKKKRDTDDETKKSNILFLEIQDAVKSYNDMKNTRIDLSQLQNPIQLIGQFMFSRSRPQAIIESLDIIYQTSEGDGIGFVPKSLYASPFLEDDEDLFNKFTAIVVPKTIIGDKVKIRLNMHHEFYSEGVLLEVLNADSRKTARKDKLIVCNNFDKCSGCQFQMLSYDNQLKAKRETILKAYRFFYPDLLSQKDLSDFGHVHGCDQQYAYRTKLTPHYRIPKEHKNETLRIGLNNVDPSRPIVDIDDCAIATSSINGKLKEKREEISAEVGRAPLESQGRQRTLLLRESIRMNKETGDHKRVCLTDGVKVITEKVDDYIFQFDPSSFFQNNNVILPQVLDYIKYHIQLGEHKYKYLVDTYCGVGLFGIALSKEISKEGKIFGIELSEKSIEFATHNAKLNGLAVPDRIQFIPGTADSMFKHENFSKSGIQGEDSIVIMDPSRKGSTESFIKQLLEFKPKLIVYVSCNVFTQARDLSVFNDLQKNSSTKYKVREIVGFDFFPQTKHVETVAVLELIDSPT
ncbi:RNA methyltransferase [Scheffersomyces xylosifermentans]|uniref:RNA methyltransferase n=1 Tax=Scheffersomyces xylosifermentans TaxID=1304137 RepID=UPI00315DAAE7